jgi:DNA-binding SARP family transcriptional activator
MTPRVRFRVLGPVRAWRDDLELDLGSPQQQATLAVLLLHEGRLTQAHELISALWGDEPPQAAAGTIRTYISRLRRVLESGEPGSAIRIESLGGGYALRVPDQALDVTSFRQYLTRARTARRQSDPEAAATALGAAIELWQGVPLAGLSGPYAHSQRAGLEQALLTAREERLTLELELGHHAQVSAELADLAAQHPLREQFHELLMLALYRSGRQAEALKAFKTVRNQLTEELGVDPGPRLQRLQQQILQADPALLPDTSATGLIDGSITSTTARSNPIKADVPRQLPADLPDFTGRTAVLTQITGALTRTDVAAVLAINGAGGIGKTAVAIRAAHQVSSKFTDGQLFVSLNGLGAVGGGPADPDQVLRAALRSFGIPQDRLPQALGELAALWRTVLSDRRVLIVLDDAVDFAQVRHLLPASTSSAVIVTSRHALTDLPTSARVTLDAFSPDEAVSLLGRIAGADRPAAEPDAARQLAAVCSYIPHAVRLAAGRLTARPHWSIEEISQRVCTDLAHRVDSLAFRAPFQRGYDRLDELEARALRLLSVSDRPILTAACAAAVLQISRDAAEDVLESLADVHLIEAGARGQYAYQDLVKIFARQLAYATDGSAACLTAWRRLSPALDNVPVPVQPLPVHNRTLTRVAG